MAQRIEDYALLGDCESAALVGRDGSIDWLCWPRFDAPACFAALLGGPEHGRWRIAPEGEVLRVSRRYRPGTLVLETTFETPEGAALLVDFMPLGDGRPNLVRLVRGLRGRVRIGVELVIRFDYGSTMPWVFRLDGGELCAVAGPDKLVLRTPAPLRGEGFRTLGAFDLGEGETVPFSLAYGPSHEPDPDPVDPEAALAATEGAWRDWSGRCRYDGPYAEAVRGSIVALKALTYRPTGGIVAAATTSLPERIGGVRNWDYRFCWLRDSTFALMSLVDAGYQEEAAAWRDWLMRAVAGAPDQMRIMYGIAGERFLPERELPWLPGYEGSRPVRTGNGAAEQVQLDVYGEVMDAMYQARKAGLPPIREGWQVGLALLKRLEEIWQEPDEGIWEVRGGRRHFVHSKVMAWVAFDRGVRSVEEFGVEGPVERWRAVRDEIRDEVCRRGFDPELGSFVQAYGSKALDASLLLLPLVGFLPPDDPRVVGTVAAVERGLVRDGLVLRYDAREAADGLPPGEGAFLACSFWLADNLILQGRREEARALFERLLALRNDVGLLAEEYDPRARRQLGNFPQAFSHLALVDTAMNLREGGGPAGSRAG